MKKDKAQFSKAIQSKFILLRVFTACIIVLLSVACIFFVQKIADDSATVVSMLIPKLHATQEITSAVFSAGVAGSAVLNTEEFHAEHPGNVKNDLYERQFNENIDRAHLFLTGLALGTQSDAFMELEGGQVRQQWEALALGSQYEIKEPSSDLKSYALQVKQYLTDYENAFAQTLAASKLHSELDAVHEEVPHEDASASSSAEALPVEAHEHVENDANLAAHMQLLELEEKAVSDLLGPVNATLRDMNMLLENQVHDGTAFVNESNQSKQILISLIALLCVVITLFVGIVFSSRVIVKPLEELIKTAEEMADGHLSKRVKIFSKDEIGKLAFTFNKMAARLEASYDDLEKIVKEKTEALSSVLEKFERKNEDLEKSQMATINLLEDLEEEKQAVEQRVLERTKELEQEKNKLLQVTSNMKGGGILLDKEYRVVFTNDETHRLIDIDKDTQNEEILEKFFTHFGGAEMKEYFARCVAGETFRVDEIDGGGRVYEIFFHNLKTGEEVAGYFILFFDITDAKLLERSKSELVAVASHQLRTPLTAMRGNVEMLIDESFGKLNKEQHELLADVDVSTIRLITMVNEMLDITKIEKGDLEMNIEKIDLKESITSVVNDLSTYSKRHEFVIDTSSLQESAFVEADRVRLRQIFQNLIDNAIKYSSHPGKLEISSHVQGKIVEIAFKDNGIGIPKNEQVKLFERFYRASNTAKTASSGSGLGLYIVKSIARQLGGDIRFESEEDIGTTFFVTLPVAVT